MQLDEATFYDRERIAILPMAFCFPGYNAKGSDLPPPPVCAKTWHARVSHVLGDFPLTLLIGGYAQKFHLNDGLNVTDCVRNWHKVAPRVFPLPHPSWRNTAWLKANPWFETDVLPALRDAVRKALK